MNIIIKTKDIKESHFYKFLTQFKIYEIKVETHTKHSYKLTFNRNNKSDCLTVENKFIINDNNNFDLDYFLSHLSLLEITFFSKNLNNQLHEHIKKSDTFFTTKVIELKKSIELLSQILAPEFQTEIYKAYPTAHEFQTIKTALINNAIILSCSCFENNDNSKNIKKSLTSLEKLIEDNHLTYILTTKVDKIKINKESYKLIKDLRDKQVAHCQSLEPYKNTDEILFMLKELYNVNLSYIQQVYSSIRNSYLKDIVTLRNYTLFESLKYWNETEDVRRKAEKHQRKQVAINALTPR